MVKQIKKLSKHLTNQIAAGEVIERPASIIKELIENSLDANAKKISIILENGGLKSIKISDDGEGIDKISLNLAIQRHATSKISSYDNLMSVKTNGFRGEALASINSVSDLKIISRTYDSDLAYCLDNNDEIMPISSNFGTTVIVKNLFYNTPARKKFIRSERTEYIYIEAIVKKLLLSNFNVEFSFTHNNKLIYNSKAANNEYLIKKRLSLVFSENFVENSIHIEQKSEEVINCYGWIGIPTFNRAQSDWQYFYINNRMVKDKILSQAVRNAFSDVLFHGRHPAYILYLKCPYDFVDVNVHPAKTIVRFANNQTVYKHVNQTIKQVITQPLSSEKSIYKAPANEKVHQLLSSYYHKDPKIAAKNMDILNANSTSLSSTNTYVKNHKKEQEIFNQQQIQNINNNDNKLGYSIGQLAGIYILAENKQGLVIIDMHAAHERITYEKLKKQYYDNNLVSQRLILPETIELNISQINIIEKEQDNISKLGFEIDIIGQKSIIVRCVPSLLTDSNITELIQDLLSDIASHQGNKKIEYSINEMMATIACHSSIRANRKLSIEEMNGLLREMEQTMSINQCNHGRATWSEFSIKQLDNLFQRGK